MREGARFVTRPCVKKINLNYIVKRLNRCADKYGGCEQCPDLGKCLKAYDLRCNQGMRNTEGI